MIDGPDPSEIPRLLALHQALHDPVREPRNGLLWLPELRRWQAGRLRTSFERFLHDPSQRPAAEFFLQDVYGDRDFARRDADIARVLPMMQRLLPASLLRTVAGSIELGTLTHALDLDVAQTLQTLAPRRRRLDEALYAEAYRRAGDEARREHQIDLIEVVGHGLASGLRRPGISALLKLSRGPAAAAGLSELQGFLERGFAAFSALTDVGDFIGDIVSHERALSARLFAGAEHPFDVA